MNELPYKSKFDVVPEVPIEDLVNYFNIELTGENDGNKLYSGKDFIHIGVFEVNGSECMYWKVKGEKICAAVRPFDDSCNI